MTGSRPRGAVRLATGVRAGQGLLLLLMPARVLRDVAGGGQTPPPAVARVLGARMLGQAILESAHPSRNVLRLGLAVDAAHAGTMLVAARLRPRYRRAALTSAAAAGAATLVDVLILRAGPASAPA